MMLMTIDFLVGEKKPPFSYQAIGLKECMHNILGEIHKIYLWLLLWSEKMCILSSLQRQWSVLLTWEKAYELPADQETDIGISCSSFIAQLLNTDPDCPPLLTQFYAVYCLPLNGNIFSQASFLALVNIFNGTDKNTQVIMVQSKAFYSFPSS